MGIRDISLKTKLLVTNALMVAIPICVLVAVGAALLGLAFGTFLREELTELGNPGFACLFACAFGAVISQVGDLAASAIKRDHEVKDYGDLIPGHGGILDRFDSLLFTAPAIFFALFLYSQIVHH